MYRLTVLFLLLLYIELASTFSLFTITNKLLPTPLLMSSMMSWGWWPSTWQPTDQAVPRISSMVPESSLAKDGCCIFGAMLTISSKVVFPLCAMFFCFFLSRGGSLRAFDHGGTGRRHHLSLRLPVLCGQFHCNPQTLPMTVLWRCWCHHRPFFGDRCGGQSWGPGPTWHRLPGWCTSGTWLWSWGQTPAVWWRQQVLDGLGFTATKESCTFTSSEPKAG